MEGGDFFMAVTEPIRSRKQLNQIAEYWLKSNNFRNYTMIIMGTCTALRIGDLLRIKWNEVYDEENDTFKSHLTLTEKKTGKEKTIALNPKVIAALRLYLPHRRGEYVFSSNRKGKPISRIQAWRIIREAANAIKVTGNIACHSLRKTFGYFAWKDGVMPVMLMDIFNHSSFDITRCYLGITQDDRDDVYMKIKLF